MLSQLEKYSHKLKDDDVLTRYHMISSKIKKRVLRKPNIAEAAEQFEQLAGVCEHKNLWQYCGLCLLAAARCHGTQGHSASEINLLVKAGRQFLTGTKKSADIGCSSMGQEDLQAAINSFNHALSKCNDQSGFGMMAVSLAMELGKALGANSSGVQYLRKAADTQPTVQAINMLVSYYIKQGDYVPALQILTELVEMIENRVGIRATGNYKNILHKCEISRVLLLLILQPTPLRLAPALAQILEKYAWEEESAVGVLNINEDEMLLLQSLVLACQSRDYESLLELEGEFWPYMDTEQKELFRTLVKTISKE